jgi:hypothetical protein
VHSSGEMFVFATGIVCMSMFESTQLIERTPQSFLQIKTTKCSINGAFGSNVRGSGEEGNLVGAYGALETQ